MESHHPTTAEVKNLLVFSEIVVLLPFFWGRWGIFGNYPPGIQTKHCAFSLGAVHLFIAFPRQALWSGAFGAEEVSALELRCQKGGSSVDSQKDISDMQIKTCHVFEILIYFVLLAFERFLCPCWHKVKDYCTLSWLFAAPAPSQAVCCCLAVTQDIDLTNSRGQQLR